MQIQPRLYIILVYSRISLNESSEQVISSTSLVKNFVNVQVLKSSFLMGVIIFGRHIGKKSNTKKQYTKLISSIDNSEANNR